MHHSRLHGENLVGPIHVVVGQGRWITIQHRLLVYADYAHVVEATAPAEHVEGHINPIGVPTESRVIAPIEVLVLDIDSINFPVANGIGVIGKRLTASRTVVSRNPRRGR